jgi:hypothetical protein
MYPESFESFRSDVRASLSAVIFFHTLYFYASPSYLSLDLHLSALVVVIMVSAARFARQLHTIVKRSLRAALDTVVTFAESEQAQRAASCLAPAAAIAELASSSISLRRLYAERVAQADCEAIAAMAGIINRSVATSEDALGFSTYSKEMCEVKFGQSQPLTEQDGSSLLLNLADSPMADLDSLFESSAEPDESDERSLDCSEGCDSNVGSESRPHFCTLREEMNSM